MSKDTLKLAVVSISLDKVREIFLPMQPLSSGPIIYLRGDNKPLLKHHYKALSKFVCREAIEAAGAQGLSEEMMALAGCLWATKQDLKKLLTKDNFRAFWACYCEGNGLEATPYPPDI